MITGSKAYCDRISQQYECPEHGAKLVTAWDGKLNSYVIRCGEGHYPEELTRIKSPIQQYKAGEIEAHYPPLDLMYKYDLSTGKDLSAQQIIELLRYADKYGLDAYRGHVMMMYGKPYIGIDGYLWHARKQNTPYQLRSRPLDKDEREAIRLGDHDHGWKAEITMLDGKGYFVGIGIVTEEEMNTMSDKKPDQRKAPVVAAHPWQLAQKRSEWQALRRAFPIGETQEEKPNKVIVSDRQQLQPPPSPAQIEEDLKLWE